MHDFTTRYVRCVNCLSRLEAEVLVRGRDFEEGFLACQRCRARYPVISGVLLLVSSLPGYFSARASLGGELMLMARTGKMRSFVRQALAKVVHGPDDTAGLEKKWVGIYKGSPNRGFYSRIAKVLETLSPSDMVLEHGCSIGRVARMASGRAGRVFGIDKSFYAIAEARRGQPENSDFVVADSLERPFGRQKFDMVIALNLLDIVEPASLLKVTSSQSRRTLVLSDPYDYDRGKKSVRRKMGPVEVRSAIAKHGFRTMDGTARPLRIPWTLKANPRLELRYQVDLVVARKSV